MVLKKCRNFLFLAMLTVSLGGFDSCPVQAKFSYEQNSLFTADRRLTEADKLSLRHQKIQFVYVKSGANPDLFSTPKIFPNVRQVQLLGSDFLPEHLVNLASNYSDLENLYIATNTPLSTTALANLRRLKKLKVLTLRNSIDDSSLLEHAIPKGIEWLAISDATWILPELPRLKRLDIWDCTVTASFFESLQAPRLHTLVLTNTFVEKGALNSVLNNLPKLKELDLSAAHLEALSDIDVLRDRKRDIHIIL